MSHEVLLVTAFSMGVVVVFSPCATALLPAYLSFYMARAKEEPEEGQPSWPRLVTAGLLGLIIGAAVLLVGLVSVAVRPGGPEAIDAAVTIAGGFALVLSAFLTWEGARAVEPSERRFLWDRIRRAVTVGGIASLGIGTVYFAIGLAVRTGLQGFQATLPWIAFASATVLLVIGLLMALGLELLSFVPHVRAPRGKNVPAFYLFGAGYALVASGCFLPVFIQVIAASAVLDLGESVQILTVYALGSAVVFLVLSIFAGAAQGTLVRILRRWRRHVHRVAGAIVAATAAYVMWFDWTYILRFGF